MERFLQEIADCNLEVYEQLNATNIKEARAEFLNNPDLNVPNFEYKNYYDEAYANIRKLGRIEAHIVISQELTDEQIELLGIIIEDLKRANRFLMLNRIYCNMAENKKPEQIYSAKMAHRVANEKYYGAPNETVFRRLLAGELKVIREIVPTLNGHDQEIYLDLQQRLAKLGLDDLWDIETEHEAEKSIAMEKFRKIVRQKFARFNNYVPHKESFTPEEAAEIVNSIILHELRPSTGTKFHAETCPAAIISINPIERIYKVPTQRVGRIGSNFDYDEMISLLTGHELAHLLRAIRFEGCIEPLTTGLPHYLASEEGIATLIEQALTNRESDHKAERRYVNISLFYHSANFRDAFEIRRAIDYLTALQNTTQANFDRISEQTFNEIRRASRGTGVLPNCKDLAYYSGILKVQQYIVEHIDEDDMLSKILLCGKIDISDRKQWRISQNAENGAYGTKPHLFKL